MEITANDIGNAWQEALSRLPEKSKVYTMSVVSDFSLMPLQSEPFSAAERQAYDTFFGEVNNV